MDKKELISEVVYDGLYKDNIFYDFIQAEQKLAFFAKELKLPEKIEKDIMEAVDDILKEYYLDDIIFDRMVNNLDKMLA